MSRESSLSHVIEGFQENRESVTELMRFDRAVLDVVVSLLESLEEKTQKAWARTLGKEQVKLSPQLEVKKTIQLVRGIRDHQSLQTRYEAMLNQALVLLVSYFGSAVRDLFRVGIRTSLKDGGNPKLLRTSVKTRVSDLKDVTDPADFVAEWLTQRSELSFQDMKSIGRGLRKYFGLELSRGRRENEIIMGQACRHAIVHSGATVDDQLVRQVRNAVPRRVKPRIEAGERLQFSEDEVNEVGGAMEEYLSEIASRLEETLFSQPDQS